MKDYIVQLLRENLLQNQIFYHGSKRDVINWDERNEKTDYNLLGYGIYLTDNKEEAIYYATNSSDGYLHKFNPENANILNWYGEVPENLETNIKKDPNLYDLFKRDVELDMYGLSLVDGCSLSWDELESDLPEWAIENQMKPGWFVFKNCNGEEILIDSGLSENELIELIKKYPPALNKTIEINKYEFYSNGKLSDEMSVSEIFSSFSALYLYLFMKMKSTKEVSMYLSGLGVDGIIAQQDTTDISYYSGTKPTVMVIYNPDKFKYGGSNKVIKNK